jgi:hypothetical protein
MRKSLDKNDVLRERTTWILRSHIEQKEKSTFILRMASLVYLGTDECVVYLEEVLRGITEEKTSQEKHA